MVVVNYHVAAYCRFWLNAPDFPEAGNESQMVCVLAQRCHLLVYLSVE